MVDCRVIHPNELETEVSSGAMTRLAGVSESLVGSTGIHLAIASIQAGCASSPHYHVNCESAIYVLKGQGRFLTGNNLENSLTIGFHLCAPKLGASTDKRRFGADGAHCSPQHPGRDRGRSPQCRGVRPEPAWSQP